MLRRLTHRCSLLGCLVAAAWAANVSAANEPDFDFFETRIRPIFSEHCQQCHGAKKQEAGLRLDSPEAVTQGSDNGPVIIPGKPEESLLMEAVRYGGDMQMPPDGKLPDELLESLTTWIQMGAPWPTPPATAMPAADPKQHWSFQPLQPPPVPVSNDNEWITSPIDAFIWSRLEAAGLSPSPAASRATLIRRAYFDLWGIPPTPAEVVAFEQNPSPRAFEEVINQLLNSPRYGERWGRHWLDVARYADTKGYVRLQENPKYCCSWTYRDYVIRSFNEDLPYNQFIVQQLAADQLELGDDPRPLAALGFLTLGQRFINSQPDIIDDRIDVITRGLLGLTVSCARCHDHKFDPISTREYYGLYGVFASSLEPRVPPLILPAADRGQYSAYLAELQQRTQRFEQFLETQRSQLETSFRQRAGEYLYAGQHEDVQPNFLPVMFLIDAKKDLNPVVVQRWARLLKQNRRTTKFEAVLAPWRVLANLPDSEFSAEATKLIETWTSAAASAFHPTVVAALRAKPPQNLMEVSQIYQQLFQQVDQQWCVLQNEQPGATQLTDPLAEQIRQLLYGPDSPMTVALDDVQDFLFVDTTTQNQFHEHQKLVEDWIATAGAAPHAMALVDAAEPITPQVFIRGNPSNPGEEVPRAFLEILSPHGQEPFSQGSGRLELARAIASQQNPLTARVLVNRVWMQHFGTAIVRTPSDFGLRSETPTHPQLLDYLAWRFMQDGWSIKNLHRLIMLSSTYQQSSSTSQGLDVDPENTLLWRMNRRRMDWESLRDSLLAVSGQLDATMGGPSVDLFAEPYSRRRTVYGFVDRQNLPHVYRTFDFVPADATSPQRFATTVPQQALFLMNSHFIQQQTTSLASRQDVVHSVQLRDQIDTLYQLLFARSAELDELQFAEQFLKNTTADDQASPADDGRYVSRWEEYVQALLLSNQFIFID